MTRRRLDALEAQAGRGRKHWAGLARDLERHTWAAVRQYGGTGQGVAPVLAHFRAAYSPTLTPAGRGEAANRALDGLKACLEPDAYALLLALLMRSDGGGP